MEYRNDLSRPVEPISDPRYKTFVAIKLIGILVMLIAFLVIPIIASAQPFYQSKMMVSCDGLAGPQINFEKPDLTPSYVTSASTTAKTANIYAILHGRGFDKITAVFSYGGGLSVNLDRDFRISFGAIVDQDKEVRGQVGLFIKVDNNWTIDAIVDNKAELNYIKQSRLEDWWYEARLMYHIKENSREIIVGLMARANDGAGLRSEFELFGGLYGTVSALYNLKEQEKDPMRLGVGLAFRY